MRNRYLLFKGENYYPMGGWDDFDGAYESRERAVANALNWAAAESKASTHGGQNYADLWWHVIDVVEQEEVANGDERGESRRSD